MISFFLSPYNGSFFNQLNYIKDNAWMYYITKLYFEDNFFTDIIDLKYYPSFLKKKENIDMIYIPKINNKIYQIDSTNELIKMFCSNEEYYINFEYFLENYSPNSKHFIQLINRFNFRKEKNEIDYLLYTFSTKYTQYFLYKTFDFSIKLTLDQNISIFHQCNYDNNKLHSDGYLFAYKKIENNDD